MIGMKIYRLLAGPRRKINKICSSMMIFKHLIKATLKMVTFFFDKKNSQMISKHIKTLQLALKMWNLDNQYKEKRIVFTILIFLYTCQIDD